MGQFWTILLEKSTWDLPGFFFKGKYPSASTASKINFPKLPIVLMKQLKYEIHLSKSI